MLLPYVKEAEQFVQLFGREFLTFDVSLQRSQVFHISYTSLLCCPSEHKPCRCRSAREGKSRSVSFGRAPASRGVRYQERAVRRIFCANCGDALNPHVHTLLVGVSAREDESIASWAGT